MNHEETRPVGDVSPIVKRRHLDNRNTRVFALAAALWVLGGIAVVFMDRRFGWSAATDWSTWPSFIGLAVGFFAVEVFVVHLHYSGEAHSYSLVELPLALGLYFASPAALIGAQFVGASLALIFHRKQGALKVFFNLATFFFATVVVVGIFRALPHAPNQFDQTRLMEGAGALVAGSVVTGCLVFAVISILTKTWRIRVLLSDLRFGLLTSALTTSLAVIAAIVIDTHPALVVLAAVPTVGIYVANWAYTTQQRRHEGLAFLYEFTAGLTGSSDLNSTLENVIAQTSKVLRAADASILLSHDEGAHFSLNGQTSTIPAIDDPVWRAVVDNGRPVCLARGSSDYDGYLAAHGLKDLMAVPLVHGDEVIGALVARDRLGDISTFDEEDLSLFSTMANQTTVTLQNLRLIDRLRDESAERRHQAFHDSLTGLPNRAQLYSVLDQCLAGGDVAVAMLDLDRFKEVNDSLGHHAGDEVLIQTAERLRRTLPTSALVARLGGDEFAIVLFGVQRVADAMTKLNTLELALTQPIQLDTMSVRVDVSIGVALAPKDGSDRTTLMRCADVAMYAAKLVHGTAMRSYDHSQERTSKRSLELAGELRKAIEDDHLDVVFQPKARLSDGAIVGTEALARWQHPTFGRVGPDEFVPLAERAGFVDALTAAVLRKSLAACAEWQLAGYQFGVAVNVDAQTLIGQGFAESVQIALNNSGVAASALTLEITERDLVRELEAATAVITQLRATGISVSIDDFGTGYSSLSYLSRLPVDEIKIDRSFLAELGSSTLPEAIIRAITDIARNLGATTVVEGIEDESTWQTISSIGCDYAQGFHLARPMSQPDLMRWLADNQAQGSLGADHGVGELEEATLV